MSSKRSSKVGVKERQGLRAHVYIDPRVCMSFLGFYRKVSCQNSSVNKSMLCIHMISFRLHKRQRSTQVTFDTNQLEEKEKREKREKIMIIASTRIDRMHITMIEID